MSNNTLTAQKVDLTLADLIAHLDTELEFAVACYEDGTLSPRRSLQYIREKLLDLKQLTNNYLPMYACYNLEYQSSTLAIQPPATPEML